VAFLIAIFEANSKLMAVLSSNEIKIKYVVDAEGLSKANSEWDKITKEEQEAVNKLKNYNKEVGDTGKKVENLGGQFGNLKELIAGAFTITAVVSFGKAVFDTTAKFEKLAAVLKNTLGSGSAAALAIEGIKTFAKTTPFSVEELTSSFVKLANQGFKPTTDQMRKLGDLASSTGKSFDQLTEAIIDAQVGEFERLKEFGVRAQKAGDQVTFTFKGVKTQVDFTNESIQQYLISLGNYEGVAGAAAAVSDTLGGKVNNLGDAWDNFLNKIGTLLKPILTEALNTTSEFMDKINNLFGQAKSDAERFSESELATYKMAQSQMVNMTDDELDAFVAKQKKTLQQSQEELKRSTETANKYGAAQRAAMQFGFGFKELKDANKIIEQSNLDISDAKGKIAAAEEQIKMRTDNTLKTQQVLAAAQDKINKEKDDQAKKDEKIYQLKLKQLQVEKEILTLQAKLRGSGSEGPEKVYAENVYQLKKQYLGRVKDLNEQEVESASLTAQLKTKEFEEASKKELLITKQAKIEIANEDNKLYEKRLAAMKQWQKDYEKGLDDEVKAQKNAEEQKEAIRQKATELGQTLVSGAFDIYQAQLNNEMSSLQKRYDEEIRLADGNKQKITEINERKAASEKDIKTRQFRAEQLNAIANIWFQAAPQIVKYGANPATIPLAVLVASIAAAQTGFVAAQPIPEFAEGTKGKPFKGGKAIVGERGVEKVVTESGKVYFTPPTATLVDLPKGAQVIPNHALSKQELFMASHYANRSNSTASPVVGKLDELSTILKSLPITQLNMDERGFEKYIRTPRRTTKVLNNRFRSSES
jgi:hypothetical protein